MIPAATPKVSYLLILDAMLVEPSVYEFQRQSRGSTLDEASTIPGPLREASPSAFDDDGIVVGIHQMETTTGEIRETLS
jgi:hypothetical protein